MLIYIYVRIFIVLTFLELLVDIHYITIVIAIKTVVFRKELKSNNSTTDVVTPFNIK